MWPAFPASDYYGGSAPPGPFNGRCVYPAPLTRCQKGAGAATGRFPCSLLFARRSRSPTVSQRPRHRYAVDLPCDLHGRQMKTLRRVLAASVDSETHRARPRSARFRVGVKVQDVTTPVPHVLLSNTLAGPAPSGSANTSRLCQGCSHPFRHHPERTALSYAHPLRQADGGGLSPPLEHQRLTAQTVYLTDPRGRVDSRRVGGADVAMLVDWLLRSQGRHADGLVGISTAASARRCCYSPWLRATRLALRAARCAFCCCVVPRLSAGCSRGGHCWFLAFGAVLAPSGGEWTRFAVVDGGDRCGEDVLWWVR